MIEKNGLWILVGISAFLLLSVILWWTWSAYRSGKLKKSLQRGIWTKEERNNTILLAVITFLTLVLLYGIKGLIDINNPVEDTIAEGIIGAIGVIMVTIVLIYATKSRLSRK